MDGPVSSVAPADVYILRRATNADAEAVLDLISTVLAEFGIRADRETTERDLSDIEAGYDRAGGEFFVMLHKGRLVGTVALRPGASGDCELCRMYLAAPFRGLGLGRRLFDHAMARARRRGFREVFLKTASVLSTAIALYERAGFRPVASPGRCGNCDRMMRMRLD